MPLRVLGGGMSMVRRLQRARLHVLGACLLLHSGPSLGRGGCSNLLTSFPAPLPLCPPETPGP